jgi:hypothetical protein
MKHTKSVVLSSLGHQLITFRLKYWARYSLARKGLGRQVPLVYEQILRERSKDKSTSGYFTLHSILSELGKGASLGM